MGDVRHERGGPLKNLKIQDVSLSPDLSLQKFMRERKITLHWEGKFLPVKNILFQNPFPNLASLELSHIAPPYSLAGIKGSGKNGELSTAFSDWIKI